MTLLPGDVIATGTPGGTGPLRPGDKVEVRIESLPAIPTAKSTNSSIGAT